jgi:leader peptidase (prepilin peptidase)/N-methyltransferase
MANLFLFIIGITIGSFLNVCIYRIPREESLAFPPSHCTSCNGKIAWYDLIPVASFILLRGRCRHCKSKISIIYPCIEVLNGLLYMLIYNIYGVSLTSLIYMVLVSTLIVISIIDIKSMWIYDSTVIPIIACSILNLFLISDIKNQIVAAIIIFLIFKLLSKLNGVGEGDIPLFTCLPLLFSWENALYIIAVTFIIGSLIAITLVCVLKKKTRKDYLPIGQFIFAAIIVYFLFNYSVLYI